MKAYSNNHFILMFLIVAYLCVGCATTPDDELSQQNADKTANALYKEAKNALEAGDYETAIHRLESLEARFPFGRYAQQAQLDISYAYYKYDEPNSAVSSCDRFIKLYPRHPNVDYAYYLKGVIKFNQGRSAFDALSSQDPAKRDPAAARKSFQYFANLINRFPDSQYAEDAIERMAYLRNSLARHEIHVAQFNMKRGAYVAAANRAKHVIQQFQRSPSVPEALIVLTRAYHNLRLYDLAADTIRVLEYNFQDHNKITQLKRLKRL